METAPFKICMNCSADWKTLDDFLSDPELKLAGYQVAFEDLEGGLFYFNHCREKCGTTLALPVKEFTSLSPLPILTRRGTVPDSCIGLCVRRSELMPCPVACECVWVREIMQVVLNWKK